MEKKKMGCRFWLFVLIIFQLSVHPTPKIVASIDARNLNLSLIIAD